MPVTDILIILFGLALLSLAIVSVVNQRERRRRAIALHLNTMRRRAQRLEELAIEVDQLLESRTIPRLINDQILRLVEQMRQASPDAVYLDALQQTAQARADALADEGMPVVLDRLKESDLQIARAKNNLEDTAATLNGLRNRNVIDVEEMSEFARQLKWASLMVEALSLIGQGHKALRRSDIMSAHAFYKKAQHALMKSTHSDPRRHRMIKELSEILTGKRSAMSEDLMPESHLNPRPAPENL